nr:hypothetical protein CFP56_12477 [Quercus suber]
MSGYRIFVTGVDVCLMGERDCAVWLQAKGKLRKKDQQYGEWLQVDPVISGASQSQAPWWRKQNGLLKKPGNQPGNTALEQPQDENGSRSATAMESNENLVDVDSSNRIANHREVLEHECGLEADVASLKIVDGVVNSPRKDAFRPYSVPLTDITNRGFDDILDGLQYATMDASLLRWAQTPRTDLQAKKRHRDSATASPPVVGDGLIRGSLTMLLLSATGSRILLDSRKLTG